MINLKFSRSRKDETGMKNFKKAVALVLAVMLVVMAVPTVSFAQGETSTANYSDFPTDWSQKAMGSAVANGLIHGFGDGTVRPHNLLTRAEMAAIINRVFGAEAMADIEGKYLDVLPEHWFSGDISKAVKMKTFEGVSSNMMNPDAPITRQDAMLVIARALVHSVDDVSVLNKFSDKAAVADYAANEVAALVGRGYVNGYEDATLRPTNNVTRAEFAQMMYNIFAVYERRTGEISLGNVNGNVVLTGDNIVLKNSVINGDLIIGDGVFDTTVNFNNVEVTGRIVFRGGSAKVYFNQTKVGGLIVTNDMNEDINGSIFFYHYSYEKLFANAVYNTSAKFIDKTVSGGTVAGEGLKDNDTAYVGKTDAGTGKGTTGGSVSGGGPVGPTNYTVQFTYNALNGESFSGNVSDLTVSVPVGGNTIPAGSFPVITKAYHDQKSTWYVDANSNNQYDNGETVVDANYVVAGNLVLRPMWDEHHKILLEVKDTSGNPDTYPLYVDVYGTVEPGQFFPATNLLTDPAVVGWFEDLNGNLTKDDNEPYLAKGTDGGVASGTVTNGFTNKPLNASTNFVAFAGYSDYIVQFEYDRNNESFAGNVSDLTVQVPHGGNTIPAGKFPAITKVYHDQKTTWYIDENGNLQYDNGETIVDSTYVVSGNIVLRPMWDEHHKILLETKDTSGNPTTYALYVDQNGNIEQGQLFPETNALPEDVAGEVKGWFQDLNGDGIKDANEPYLVKGTDGAAAAGTVTNNFTNKPLNQTTSFAVYKEYTVQFTYDSANGESFSGNASDLTASVPQGTTTSAFPAITKAYHDQKTTWYVDANGNNQYDNGEVVYDDTTAIVSGVVLRPMWDEHHKILLEVKDNSGNPATYALYVDQNGNIEQGQLFPETNALPEDVAGEVKGWFQDLDGDGFKDANEPYLEKGTDGAAASGLITNNFVNKPLNATTPFKVYKEYIVEFTYAASEGESFAGSATDLIVSVAPGGNKIPAGKFPAITKAYHDQKTTWYVDANSNNQYDNGETVVDANTVITANTVLRPMWDEHHKILVETKDTLGNPSEWTLYIDATGTIEQGQFFPSSTLLPEDVAGEVKGWFQDLDGDGIKDANEPYIVKGTDGAPAAGTVTNNFTNKPLNASTSFKAYKEYTVTFIYNDGTQDITIRQDANVPHGSTVALPTETEFPVLVGKDWYDGTNKVTTTTIVVTATKTINAATRMLNVTFYDAGSTGYEIVGGPYSVPYGTTVDQAFIASANGLTTIRGAKDGYVANSTNIHSAYPENYTHKIYPEWYRATRESGKFTLCDRLTSAGYTVTEDADFYYLNATMQIGLGVPSVMNNANYSINVPVDGKSNLAATVLDTLYNGGLKTAVTGISTKLYERLSSLGVNATLAGYNINYVPFKEDANGNLLINNVTYKYKLLDFLGASNVDTLIDDAIGKMLEDDQLRHDIIIELLKQIAEEGTETVGGNTVYTTDGELITKFDTIMMDDPALLAKIKDYAKNYAKTSSDYVNETYVGDAIEEEIGAWIEDFVPANSFENTAKDKAGEFAADYVENNYYAQINTEILAAAENYAADQIAAKETEIKNNIKVEFITKALTAIPELAQLGITADLNGFNTWWNHSETLDAHRTEYTTQETLAYNAVAAEVKVKAVNAVKVSGIIEDIQAQVKAIAKDVATSKVDNAFITNAYQTVKVNALANLKNLNSYKTLPGKVVTMLRGSATEVVYNDDIPLGNLDINFNNIGISKVIAYNKPITFDINVPVDVEIEIAGTKVTASTTVTKNYSGTIDGQYTINENFSVSETINLGTYNASYTITKAWVHGKIDSKVENIFADQTKRRTEIIKLAGDANIREEIDSEIDSIIANYADDHEIMQELENVAHTLYQTQIDAFKYSLANHDMFTFDKDDTFIVDAMEAKLKTVTYDEYKNNFPSQIRELLGGNKADGGELKIIFDNALTAYRAQVDTAYYALNDPNYNGTSQYFVDTYVMVAINPIDHVVAPAFAEYVQGRLIPKLSSAKPAWAQNPYTDMLEDKMTYTMFVTKLDPANVPEGCSGYRLNTASEIYDEVYKFAVLTHDVGNYFIETVPESELDAIVKHAADAISEAYEKIAARLSALSGSAPIKVKNTVMSLVEKFMNKNTKNLWNKTLLDVVPYADVAYVKGIGKVTQILGFDASELITVKVIGTSVELSQGTKVATKSADEIVDAIVAAGLGTKAGNGIVNIKGKTVNIGSLITKVSQKIGTNFQFAAEDTTVSGKAHEGAEYLCAYRITIKTSTNENYFYFRVRRA